MTIGLVYKEVRMKKLSCFLLLALFVSSHALADQVLQKKTKILGKEFSVTEQLGSVATGEGVNALTQVKFLGKAIQLLSSQLQYTTADGKIVSKKNDLMVNGIKVWTGGGTLVDGTLSYTGSVAPTQLNMPVFSYAIGPVVLEVNAGVTFEAAMDASLTSPLLNADLSSILLANALVDTSIDTHATASGYVDALARVLIFQVGINGEVNIIDGNASVAASVPLMDPLHPTLSYDGKLQVLNGSINAFIDTKMLGSTQRIKNLKIYSWKGMCWAMGGQSCVAAN